MRGFLRTESWIPQLCKPSRRPYVLFVVHMFKNILVVCVGNICRSPMAEYLLAADPCVTAAGAVVSSAGLGALVGKPADPLTVEVMKEQGLDLSPHRARQLDSQLVRQSDLILVMEAWQQKEIEKIHPTAKGKVHTVGKWEGFDVPDPYGQSREAFERTYELVARGLTGWRSKVWKR